MADRPWTADIPEEPVVPPAAEPEPTPEPTYPRPANPLTIDGARDEIAKIVDEFVRRITRKKAAVDLNPTPIVGIRAAAGIGKTALVVERIPDLARAGLRVFVAVPTHILGDQIAAKIDPTISARVYRSRGADDPFGAKMCLQDKLAFAITGALGDAQRHACKSSKGQCEFFGVCKFQAQKEGKPMVSLGAHQYLFGKLPDYIPAPNIIIIDETFYKAADKELKLHLDWLKDRRPDEVIFPRHDELKRAENDLLIEVSTAVYQALSSGPFDKNGRIDRAMLESINLEKLRAAVRIEWHRKREFDKDYPGMPAVDPSKDPDDNTDAANAREEINKEVEALATCFEYLRDLLDGDAEKSLNLYYHPHLTIGRETKPGIRIRWRRKLHEWVTSCPILYIDATLNETIVRRDLGNGADFKHVDVIIPDPSAVFVQQLTDLPISQRSVTGGGKYETERRAHLRRIIKLIAMWHPGELVAVICQKELMKELEKGAPRNVTFMNYNKLRGRNDLEKARVEIIIDRTEPSPQAVEEQARLIFDREVKPVPDTNKHRYYDQKTRYLRLRDDTPFPVRNSAHPDDGAEAVRFDICEAEIVQAFYRARPLTRTWQNPLTVYVMTNVCLPIPVDATRTWEQMQPTLIQLMMLDSGDDGIATSSPTDAAEMFPKLFLNAEAAKKALQRGPYAPPRLVHRSLRLLTDGELERGHLSVSKKKSPTQTDVPFPGQPANALIHEIYVAEGPVATLRYRRVGAHGRPVTLYYDPTRTDATAAVAALRRRLKADVIILAEGESR
jgi:hypothetical protein